MAVELVVAGWFASAVISKLADQVRSYISSQDEYQRGEKKRLESLQRSLTKIEAVIDAVEGEGIEEDPNLKAWLNELKDAAYEAEDVLDLFEYKTLERKVESSGQVRNSINCAGTIVKRLFFSDDDLKELVDVIKRFDKLAEDGRVGTFLKFVELGINRHRHRHDDMPGWRQTTPIPQEPRVFGRSTEVDGLLNLLLVASDASASNSEKNFSVVSIVGIGGVGKTTLAQSVYNDPKVKHHFELMAWVCVSKPFNLRKVMIEIIESACIDRPHDLHNHFNLGSIQMILNKGLEGKKFLIVLDDIWDKMNTEWEKLYRTFQSGKEGSSIVVTTRYQNVADSLKSKESINLEGLEDEEFWEFFRCCAFGDVSPEDHPRLESIGKQMVKRLGGLPLAAKTVGGVLQSRMEEKHWRDVSEGKLWHYGQEEDGILPSLKLSYNHLPAHLKQCFVYCSLFPKDYWFEKNNLVHCWVALGYIRPSEGKKSLEDVGQEYFTELASRSFFQKVKSMSSFADYYVIHDLLHDLAESISKEEIYRQEDDNLVQLKIPKRVCHLYVSSADWVKVLDQVCDTKRLRSLVFNPSVYGMPKVTSRELEATFRKLKGLRILIVQGGDNLSTQVLDQLIAGTAHLRYLELPSDTHCPDSCGKLYHLQVLRAADDLYEYGTLYFESLTKTLHKLNNLRYMDFLLDCDISSIGHLTSLQELRRAFEVKKEEGYKISELRNLRQLRGCLRILGLENVSNKEEAREAELDNKEHLDKLKLYWTDRSDMIHEEDEEVLEGLQPHSNLKELTIMEYLGTKTPSWLNKTSLANIESIDLVRWYFVKVLPPLGELPFLKVLFISNLRSLESVGTEVYGKASKAFPSLEELRLYMMTELTAWSAVEDGRVSMPRLRVLEIQGCSNLKGPVPFHSSLRELKAGFYWEEDGDMSLLTSYVPANRLACLQSLFIGPLRRVETFTDEQEKWFQSLTSLKELTFTDCSHLQSLPNAITRLPSLERLHIECCDQIQSLEEYSVSSRLKELLID